VFECVSSLRNNSYIIVDFAHTPEALKQSLSALKKQFKKEIIVVFGCGGERDKKKRIVMGKIASKYCRKIFVTDDNPRNENPQKIRRSIIKGCNKSAVDIGSRKKAIKAAINELKSNEILLVAGKGHEETQDYGKRIIKFSDKKLIKKIVKNKNFSFKENNYQNFLLKKVFNNQKIKKISYSGVSINTKTIKKNNLFFAIRGKNKDGHSFVKEAIKKGAARSIVSKKMKKISNNKIIKVKNTFSSLWNLAKIAKEASLVILAKFHRLEKVFFTLIILLLEIFFIFLLTMDLAAPFLIASFTKECPSLFFPRIAKNKLFFLMVFVLMDTPL
jgi:murE/murF fusion protein